MFKKLEFKKIYLKALALIIAFACVIPFLFNNSVVNGASVVNGSPTVIHLDSEISEKLKDKESSIEFKVGDKVIYSNKVLASNNDYFSTFKYEMVNNIATITFTTRASEGFTLLLQDSIDATISKEIVINYNGDYAEPKYLPYLENKDKYDKYQESVVKAVENLKLGDDYTLPSISELFDLDYENGTLPFGYYKLTLNYCQNGSFWQSKTVGGNGNELKPSFELTSSGPCKLYVTIARDKMDEDDADSSYSLTANGLVEDVNGFYQAFSNDNQELYAVKNGLEYKYYFDKEQQEEYEGEVTLGDLIIPIFTFEVPEGTGPIIKKTSSYQENGFIGLKYTISTITVSNSVKTDYVLEFSSDNGSTWATASEEFDKDAKTFTPTKKGQYRLKVEARDDEGRSAVEYTSSITVNKEYQVVKYKTSFNDWFEVNKLPFVLLCISGACLIAIICLLFIKPKEKVNETVEQDK